MDTGGDRRSDSTRAGPTHSAGPADFPGDRAWVLKALDEHEGRLTRYALRLTGDMHAARDVVQHVFLQLCDHPPQSRNGQLTSWLFTVCHNRAMDVRRRGGRAGSLEQVPPESLGSDVDDPARTAEAGDSVELLRSVIDTLPDAQRLVVNFWSAGFRYAEIAELLGKTESYVRVASHRAWQTIRKHPRVRKLLEQQPA
ncbi:MAG: RNA polymerase sigma factor [Pirellulales bacterium]